MGSLHLNWNKELSYIFELQNTASGSFQNAISVECIFNGLKNLRYFIKILFY